MSEADVLKALVDGRLRLCAAPGCSNTFEPKSGRTLCGEDDCTRNMRTCNGPWCTERLPREKRDGPGGSHVVFCSDECRARYSPALPKAPDAEHGQVIRDTLAAMAGLNGAKLGERFTAVQAAVQDRDPAKLYRALIEASAACLETAARRGPA